MVLLSFRNSTLYQKKFLQAVIAIFHATGIEETRFKNVYMHMKEMFEMEGTLKLYILISDV